MKIFLSSVRRGLEVERDALPGLIKAIGHEPLTFEQFTAQAVPSREACMNGVDAADAYVLLLGEFYGHVFPETDQSATHDEYQRARQRGIPRLVFTKSGVDMEPAQQKFSQAIGEYGTGSFWATFSNVSELQAKVAAAVRELANRPNDLDYQTLSGPIDIEWLDDWQPDRSRHNAGGIVELHVVPMEKGQIAARIMRTMPERLVSALRGSAAVPSHAGLQASVDDNGATIEVPSEARPPTGTVYRGSLRGVRVARTGQVSAWWSLPSDGMGSMLIEGDLIQGCARALRLAGAIGLPEGTRFGVAIGVNGTLLSVADGDPPISGRTSASFGFMSDAPVRIEPDESVPVAAFDNGADEVARELAAAVLAKFRSN